MQKGQVLVWIIIGVLVIAGGAYYLGKSTSPKTSPPNSVVSQTPQSTPSPSPIDKTANWKTYGTSSYTISYPSTWILDPSLKGLNYVNGTEGFVIISSDYEHYSGSGFIKQGAVISLRVGKESIWKGSLGLVTEERTMRREKRTSYCFLK